jgi:hypothetical protein
MHNAAFAKRRVLYQQATNRALYPISAAHGAVGASAPVVQMK